MYLQTHEAQRRVDPAEYLKLSQDQQRYWLTLLVACQSPGIPIQDPLLQQQLASIWKTTSVTYRRLVGLMPTPASPLPSKKETRHG